MNYHFDVVFTHEKSGEHFLVTGYFAADGKLSVKWFNPRKGGDLQTGSKKTVKAGTEVDLGNAPAADGKDWLVIVTK
jgi:hypothetical protein